MNRWLTVENLKFGAFLLAAAFLAGLSIRLVMISLGGQHFLEPAFLLFFVFGAAFLFGFWLLWHQRFIWLDWIWLAVCFYFLATTLWAQDPSSVVSGLRHALFPLLAYPIGRTTVVYLKDWRLLVKVIGLFFVAAALFQFLFWQLEITRDWLLYFGLDIVHKAGDFPRLDGFMPGPNHLATLLVVIGLWLFWTKNLSSTLAVVFLLVILATFSRSAILGLFVASFIAVVLFTRHRKLALGVLAATIITVAAATLFSQTFYDAIHGERHFIERLAIYQDSFVKLVEQPWSRFVFGNGPGAAGPASLLGDRPIITESWPLQLILEFGLLGLGLMLGLWLGLVKLALRFRLSALLALVVAVAVNSLFLLPLADNTLAATLFYLIIGLLVADVTKKKEVIDEHRA